ncbi:hypothetical protein ABDK56_04980 [Sphingomonas sp. ASV193]|uniref:hypothetical protein n=1 Tax=Sphingomonas sp. ASV193 TaxID=3144405 RepID=UPI0032E8F6BE
MYDTLAQYRQALDGQYDDWHPPVMAWVWHGLHRLFGGAGGPMLVLQMATYWAGFGAIAAGLARAGRPVAAALVLGLAAMPLTLGWQAVLLKDCQLLGAMLAASGIVAFARLGGGRLGGGRVGVLGWLAVALLLAYAALLRANAIFAVAPLAVLLAWPGAGRVRQAVATAALVGIALVAAPVVNHRLIGASASAVDKTLPLYDLAAIGIAAPTGSPFTADELADIRARHCASPYWWDPLGEEEGGCQADIDRLQEEVPSGALYRAWAGQVAAHPLAYALHRAAHWNSTERWRVPDGLIGAGPPDEAEPNDLGLVAPRRPAAIAWQGLADRQADSPLGWPILFTALALVGTIAAWTRDEPAGRIAFALAGSALALEASFVVVSIASDLRYHLWTIVAAPLALVLLADRRPSPLALTGSVALVAALLATGWQARAALPRAPDSYQAMLGWRGWPVDIAADRAKPAP